MGYTEIKSGHPVGRKDYSCEWCDQTISKGERHLQRTYIFDGDFNGGRMHLECEAAMDRADRNDLIDGWTPGDFPRGKAHPDEPELQTPEPSEERSEG